LTREYAPFETRAALVFATLGVLLGIATITVILAQPASYLVRHALEDSGGLVRPVSNGHQGKGDVMRSPYWRRIFSALGATAILAVAGAALAGISSASPTAKAQLAGAPKFIVRYQASLDATWHNSSPVQLPDQNHTFRCGGGDGSGSFTSSVRPGGKPFVIRVGKEPGGSWLSIDFSRNGGNDKGVVTSNRTAQEWLMRYSGHECKRFDIEEPGCGAHTLVTDVAPLESITGNFNSGVSPVYRLQPAWPIEPETIGCGDGIVYPTDYRYGWEAAQLRLKQLYRCGLRKPRRCRITIGRERTYAYDQMEGDAHHTSTVHIKWSITFAAAGRG
jgi:hypothetical protein